MTLNIYKVCLAGPHPAYLHHYVTGFSGNINSFQLEFWQLINFPFSQVGLGNNSNVDQWNMKRMCKAFIVCLCVGGLLLREVQNE